MTIPRAKMVTKTDFVERAPREDGHCHADLYGPTVAPFRSRVRNISTSGMLIDCPAALHVDDVLVARLPGVGEIICTVARLRNGRAGIRFSSVIDLAVYRRATIHAV